MKLHYGWVVVSAGALMTCVAIGAGFSLAVFLAPIVEATGWSREGVSGAMTLVFLTMGPAAFGWGALSDRIGARFVTLIGAGLLGLALVLASRATTLVQFQLTYGVLVGLAAGSFFTPMIATVTGWFDTHRSLAVALVSAGVGVAPMTVSPFARWLITASDWRTAQLTIGIAAWVLLIPAALLVRRRPSAAELLVRLPPHGAPNATQAPATAQRVAPADPNLTVGQALRSPQFVVLGLTFFACCMTHSGPIFHTVSYAMGTGLSAMAAVTIYSAEGLAGLFGRIVLGVLADRIGVKRVLITGLLVQAVAAAAYLFVSRLGEFYAVAAVFGFAYGGIMPLYAVLAREYFGQRILGTIFGATTMLSSLGMALGPWVGGWIFDTYHGYAWLYISSFGVGLVAAALALAFPPQPSRMHLKVGVA
jgi:MFS family permease